MKEYKYKKILTKLFIFIAVFITCNIFDSIYAYQIKYWAGTLDGVPVATGWPTLYYRKETSAYSDTSKEYKAALNGNTTYINSKRKYPKR